MTPAAGRVAALILVLACAVPARQAAAQDAGDADPCSAALTAVDSLYSAGRVEEALALAGEAVRVCGMQHPAPHPDLADALNFLAYLQMLCGRYADAERHFDSALAVLDGCAGDRREQRLAMENNVAMLLESMGRYTEAEALYLRVLEGKRALDGERTASYATSLYNLAYLDASTGRYPAAERRYRQALAILRDTLGVRDGSAVTMLRGLAQLCMEMGRGDEAERLYGESLGLSAALFGAGHPVTLRTEADLAVLYAGMNRLAEADSLLRSVILRLATTLPPDHPDMLSLQNNRAELCRRMGDFATADSLYAMLLARVSGIAGWEREEARYRSNRAALQLDMGRPGDAETGFLRALALRERLLGSRNEECALTLDNLAEVYDQEGKVAEAEEAYRRASEIYQSVVLDNFAALSERERQAYYETVTGHLHARYRFLARRIDANPAAPGELYTAWIRSKGLIFSSIRTLRERIARAGDPALAALYRRWIATRECYVKAMTMDAAERAERGMGLDSLARAANDLERALAERSAAFGAAWGRRACTWRDVQRALRPGEAAVELARFPATDAGGDSACYAALIVTADTLRPPEAVLLPDGRALETTMLARYRAAISAATPRLGGIPPGGTPPGENTAGDRALRACHDAYWAPIGARLGSCSTVYLSADGVYHLINPATLRRPDGRYLADTLDLRLLGNTADLALRPQPTQGGPCTAVLAGFPDYSWTGAADRPGGSARSAGDDTLVRKRFGQLPGTREEIDSVARLLRAAGCGVSVLLGRAATEEAVKATAAPAILHLATHGYFLEDLPGADAPARRVMGFEVARHREHPMLRSGLLFAGCSATLEAERDDGLLTAFEAMSMHLDGTRLVVLSACETGLGAVRVGEGVYGLQRAFFAAGARTLVMSLWDVSDEATRELMTLFYAGWMAGGDTRRAFLEAQRALRVRYPAPYFWGAFVMVDG